MKLVDLLNHPSLNQLRLNMGADLIGAPPRGWEPRLLDAEMIRRLGRPEPSPLQVSPQAAGIGQVKKVKTAPPVPVRYSRDRSASKILNPIGLPKEIGSIERFIDVDADDNPVQPAAPRNPAPASVSPIETSINSLPPESTSQNSLTPKRPLQESPALDTSPPAKPRRKRNQDALEKMRKM